MTTHSANKQTQGANSPLIERMKTHLQYSHMASFDSGPNCMEVMHDEMRALLDLTDRYKAALMECAYPNITGGESYAILKTLIERQEIAQRALQSSQ